MRTSLTRNYRRPDVRKGGKGKEWNRKYPDWCGSRTLRGSATKTNVTNQNYSEIYALVGRQQLSILTEANRGPAAENSGRPADKWKYRIPDMRPSIVRALRCIIPRICKM